MRYMLTTVVVALAIALSAGLCYGEESTAPLKEKQFKDFEESQSSGFGRMAATMATPEGKEDSVTWPTFTSDKPLYGQIVLGEREPASTTPLGVAYALDRSSASQDTYDVLYIDLNMDKTFAANERFSGSESKEAEKISEGDAMDFGIVKLAGVGTNRRDLPLHVWSTSEKMEDDATMTLLQYSPWSYYEAEVGIGGEKKVVRLFDEDMDGSVAGYGTDVIDFAQGEPTPLSRIMRDGDQMLSVRISNDSTTITISSYEGPKGRVKITVAKDSGGECAILGWIRNDAGTMLTFEATEGEAVEIPAGDFTITYAALTCEADKRQWCTDFLNHKLNVKENEETTVTLGKPMSLEVTPNTEPEPGNMCTIGCRVRGAAGEIYSSYSSYSTVEEDGAYESPSPKVVITDSAGKTVSEGAIEPGGGEYAYTWTVPEGAAVGSTYTIEFTVDTGPFAGKLTGKRMLTIRSATPKVETPTGT